MSKHTPGPWHSANPGSGVEILDRDNRIVAGNVARYPWTQGTHDANVALIKAAPNLLTVLKALRGNIDVSTIGRSKRAVDRWEDLAAQADAVILAAEGEA